MSVKRIKCKKSESSLSSEFEEVTEPDNPSLETYRLMVMKRKLQLESPISRTVAKAELHKNK